MTLYDSVFKRLGHSPLWNKRSDTPKAGKPTYQRRVKADPLCKPAFPGDGVITDKTGSDNSEASVTERMFA